MSSIYSRMISAYITSPASLYADHASGWLGRADRVLGLVSSSTALGREFSDIGSHQTASEKLGTVSDAFGAARGALKHPRTALAWENFLTGKMFWQRNPDGSWFKAQVDAQGNFVKDASGNYIADQNGKTPMRSAPLILMSGLTLGARTLSMVNWLDDKKLINLGTHANRISKVNTGLWTGIISIDLANNLYQMRYANPSRAQMKKLVLDSIGDGIDLTDCIFGFGLDKINRELKIIGLMISCIGHAFSFVKGVSYYS